MTFATNTNRRTRAIRSGFTLIELLVVIGILVLLIGILLPAVSIAYKKAVITRQRADFQTIATALEQYKSENEGNYPPVESNEAGAGAAVLGKVMFGMGDAAHFYGKTDISPDDIGNASYNPGTNPKANDILANPPQTYNAGTTYNTGDVVLQGTAPQFPAYSQGGVIPFYVCLKDNKTGADPATPGTVFWASFNPFDGKDGPGFRKRFTALPDTSGVPHATGGQVVGPYLRPENFKIRGTMILDRYDSPILYFPLQTKSSVNASNGLIAPVGTAVVRPLVNVADNLAMFCNTSLEATDRTGYARIAIMLGDYNLNGQLDSVNPYNEPTLPSLNFLIWSGGPDKAFGPSGTSQPGGGTVHDFDSTANTTNYNQNRLAAEACDDITNFRNQ